MLSSGTLTHDLIGLRVRRIFEGAGAVALALVLAGCGGGSGGGAPAASATQLTGTLSAPGGALAFNTPTGLRRFFAEIFGRSAIAALPGSASVAGATVKLIEIDGSGIQVGADIAAAVTGIDGSFSLSVPASFVPGPRYVVRAIGGATLERLVSDLSAQDVDPSSHAAKSLVLAQLASGNIQNLQSLQVEEIAKRVAEAVNSVDSGGLASATTLVTALVAEAQSDEDLANSLGNLTAAGSIKGTVADSGGAPLPNIKIVVRDFNQWIARAEARTNSSGQYTLNVAPGDYIVGALNFTAASMAASEWWTCNDLPAGPACGASNMFSAAKVTVGTGATTLNFKLEPGARVQGTITSAASALPLPGVQLALRDFTNDQPVAFQFARPDGSFRINVRPGTYTVGTRNRTLLPFAGGLYNGPASGGTAAGGGGANTSEATPVTFVAGNTYTLNFPLIEGGVVRGLVTDGSTPTPNKVAGISVRFYATTASDTIGAFVEAVRTNLLGGYRMWVRPGTYAVRTRGQTANHTVVGFGADNNPAPVGFGAAVGRATAILQSPGSVPLPQVKVLIYDTTANNVFQGLEASNGDGAVDLYAQPTGSYRIEYKVDNGSTTVGSAIHDGTASPTQTQLLLGQTVAFDTTVSTPTALGTITLPAGGELKGVVTVGTVPTGNIVVQVRSGVNGTAPQRFTSTRTQSDGSYSISLPAGTYRRVCAFVAGTSGACPTAASSAGVYASQDNVAVSANQSTTLNTINIP